MVWINSEYTEEFAVLTAWLSMLLPWSVAYGRASLVGDAAKETTVVILRFPFFGIRYVLGSGFIDGTTLKTPLGFYNETAGTIPEQAAAHLGWTLAVGVVVLLLVVSLLMYLEVDEVIDRLPGRGVYAVGVLMLALASVYLWAALRLNGSQNTKILGIQQFVPVGLVGTFLLLVFAVLNLFAQRT
ncbi:hypothetical protein [Haloarchaeobius sp. HME9146]|uniref:DUF7549 family protein n=1 Tax=Haloarchaeobius sp. HME9146 TaxID=2978732 RepID=UPI0021C16681|nr:hypothetical protein [Haloarchaeobius sp. HME9146]MCT9097238.1 hypothetical protein [Haloarchaeobius sp. HME9146]